MNISTPLGAHRQLGERFHISSFSMGCWDEDGRINTGGFWERSLLEGGRPAENVDVRRGFQGGLGPGWGPELLITKPFSSQLPPSEVCDTVLIPLDIRYVSGCMSA